MNPLLLTQLLQFPQQFYILNLFILKSDSEPLSKATVRKCVTHKPLLSILSKYPKEDSKFAMKKFHK